MVKRGSTTIVHNDKEYITIIVLSTVRSNIIVRLFLILLVSFLVVGFSHAPEIRNRTVNETLRDSIVVP